MFKERLRLLLEAAQEDLENFSSHEEALEAKALVKAFRQMLNFERDLIVEIEQTRQENRLEKSEGY